MIENRFIHINEKETFESLKEVIKDESIVFCKESGEIVTHEEDYGKPKWREIGYPSNQTIYYTTNDGNIINVHNYWLDKGYTPIINEYDKEKDKGVMVFDHELTEIPGVNGHPLFYKEENLLTLKLPKTITKIGRGAFYDCKNLEYINFTDLVNLEVIQQDWNYTTNLTKIDLRNTKLTSLEGGVFYNNSNHLKTIDYILLPNTIKEVNSEAFNNYNDAGSRIKTLMIPTLSKIGSAYIENQILENLIINKFDGLGNIHYFNTDCIIWVPDEWYDAYVEKHTNSDVANWQDIISRLKKYSEGVPEFPFK